MNLPMALIESVESTDLEATQQWWDGLPKTAQQDFLMMWDERAEDCATYGHLEGDRIIWQDLPIELVGDFTEANAAELNYSEMKQHLLEYINNHEEMQFFLVAKTFHICRAHERAREVVRDGFLPADFECPRKDTACPMRHILAQNPGKNVRFYVRFKSTTIKD